MADFSPNSEPPIVEQVITEFFAKSLHIILESRSPFVSSRNFNFTQNNYNFAPLSPSSHSSPSSPSSFSSSRDKWFNLALKDCPAALENFDLWRQSNLEPLIIEILLVSKNPKSEKLLERWVVQYETRKSKSKSKTGTIGTSTSSMYNKTYKGSIVLLRSLYTVVRLLPAYSLFREINNTGTVRAVSLSHRIVPFIDPLTRLEETLMGRFSIAPIETPFGKLSVSVSYRLVLDRIGTEICEKFPTEIIHDYVGSPKTESIRRFQFQTGSVPVCVETGTRRHSWSSDPLRSLPVLVPNPKSGIPVPNPKSGIPLPDLGQKGKKLGFEGLMRCDSAPAGRGEGQNRNFSCEDNKQLVRYGTSLTKDQYEDSDIRYHFAQDEEGLIDAFNRLGMYKGERSQAAIVGELLRILKNAPNLQLGFEKLRTFTDALQDLESFTQIRNSILSQIGSSSSEKDLKK